MLTANILELRGMKNRIVCALCHQQPETATHLLLQCSFARLVTSKVWFWYHIAGNFEPSELQDTLTEWLHRVVMPGISKERNVKTEKILYAWWNIWK